MHKGHYKILSVLIFLSGCGLSNPIVQPTAGTSLQAAPVCSCKTKKTVTSNENTKPVKATATNSTIDKTQSAEKKELPVPQTSARPKKTPLELILEQTRANYSKINSYQVQMYNYAKGDYKDGKKTGKTRETFVTAKLTTKKPGYIMINISESDDSLAVGSTLFYPGSGKVKVKGGGFLGIIPVSFDINDPKLSDSRNQKLTALGDNINRLTAQGAKLNLLGTSTVSGRKVFMIKSENPIESDPEITYETFAIDAKDFFLVSNELYIKDEMVGQYLVKSYSINPDLNSDFFSL
jgi:hypothetical protein